MNGYNQYRGYQAEMAGPEERVALLYDGARRFVDQALAALEGGDLEKANLYTTKAQRILEEMGGALDFQAGEVAHNLFKLYDYWIWRLGQGLIKQDRSAFREVSGVLEDFREVWADAAKLVRAQRAMQAHG